MSRGRGPGGRGAMFADKSRTRSVRKLIIILWEHLRPYKWYIALIAFITVFYTAAATFQPIIIQQAIDTLVGTSNVENSVLVSLVILYFSLALVSWVSQSLTTWYLAVLQNRLVHSLRSTTFECLATADMSYHHTNQSGDVTSRVINDTAEITQGINVFTTTLTNLLVGFTTLGVLFYISVWFGLISLLAIPASYLITRIISTRGRRKMLAVRSMMGRVSGKLAENLAGVAIAKSFNQEDRTSNEIKELNDQNYSLMKQLGALFTMVFPSINLVSMIMIFGVVWVGGYLNLVIALDLGLIYLGTVMVRRFLSPIMQLSNNITSFQASLAALDRITDIMEAKVAVSNSQDAKPLKLRNGEFVLNDVSFAYSGEDPEMKVQKSMNSKSGDSLSPEIIRKTEKMKSMPNEKEPFANSREEKLVLQNVSFTIPATKKTALVGHTGAGKTTITKMLMRFYDPNEGSILIDDQDLRDITLESLYDNISFVSQEPYLFAGTVFENIKYGKLDASDDEVLKICELVGADQFIEALADGYNTVLTESGKSLSAGQRQMITIARTMLSDPKILILDEATSRLDAYTESLVQEAQFKLFEGRTTLIIAHRLSTIRDVDQIVVMDNAKAIEVGNHEELMKKRGKYFELYKTYYSHQGLEAIDIKAIAD